MTIGTNLLVYCNSNCQQKLTKVSNYQTMYPQEAHPWDRCYNHQQWPTNKLQSTDNSPAIDQQLTMNKPWINHHQSKLPLGQFTHHSIIAGYYKPSLMANNDPQPNKLWTSAHHRSRAAQRSDDSWGTCWWELKAMSGPCGVHKRWLK